MINDIESRIFKAFNDGNTLVFTSEIVAENWLAKYLLKNNRTSIFSDRAISWDSFKLKLVNTSGRTPADNIARNAFAAKLLKNPEVFSKLKYFANPEHPESIKSYSSAIAGYLPYFAYCDNQVDQTILEDIGIIKPAYEAFLKENNLYEFNYLYKEDKADADLSKYCIVFPQTINDPVVLEDIHGICSDINLDTGTKSPLVEYENSISEIRDVFRQINSILSSDEDARSYDIAITCASLDSYRVYMEEEAKKYDIKLHFTSEIPLMRSYQGKLFAALYKMKKEEFSFESVKNFLLNPIFPFKKDFVLKNRRIIDYAISTKLTNGPLERWYEYIEKAGDVSVRPDFRNKDEAKFKEAGKDLEYFRTIGRAITDITEESEPILIVRKIRSFVDNFFYIEKNADPSEKFVWEKCLDLLRKMRFYTEDTDTWELFMSLLEKSSYRDKNSDGIPVYSYPVSVGLSVKYHFVMGLCDDNTVVAYDKYPYWTSRPQDDEHSSLRQVIKTDDNLNIICSPALSENLYLSGTTKNFDGAHLLPVLLLNNVKQTLGKDADPEMSNLVKQRLENDYYTLEKEYFSNGKALSKLTGNQYRSHIQAENSTITESGKEELPSPEMLQQNISASYFKSYAKCPYMGFVNIYLNKEQKVFEPERWDTKVIGTILHEAIQNSLEEKKKFRSIDNKTIEKHLLEAINNHAEKLELCSEAEKNSVFVKYSKLLPKINDYSPLNLGFIPQEAELYKNELDYSETETGKTNYFKIGNTQCGVGGRPDTVLKYTTDENGEKKTGYILLDYKTSGKNDYGKSPAECSPQLAIYSRLIETNENIEVTGGAYFSVSKGEMNVVWPEVTYSSGNRSCKRGFSKEEVNLALDTLLADFEKELEKPVFRKTDDPETCQKCYYKRICRKEYVAK